MNTGDLIRWRPAWGEKNPRLGIVLSIDNIERPDGDMVSIISVIFAGGQIKTVFQAACEVISEGR